MSGKAVPITKRLAERSELQPNGCILFTGSDNGKGYGILGDRKRKVYVHRLAWELARGPIPDGLVIDHLCRNRRCVNVDHLDLVTNRENVRRGESGRRLGRRPGMTHCLNGHEYTPENTYAYRGHRTCRACQRARYARKVAA